MDEKLKEKCGSAEIRMLRAIFGIDTVNGCYELAVERGNRVDENFEFPRNKVSSTALRMVYDYMVGEIEDAPGRVQSREDRLKRLEDLKAPEVLLVNERRMKDKLLGEIGAYKKLAKLIFQLSSLVFAGAEPLVLSETFDILTRHTYCWDCRYYIQEVEEGEGDSCLLGHEPMIGDCDNRYRLDDNYVPFWEMKRNVMKELGKSDVNDKEVIEEAARRLNAKREKAFQKEAADNGESTSCAEDSTK